MNSHLYYFLLDVMSWGVVGLTVAYLVEKTEKSGVPYQYLLYFAIALFLGFFFSLNHALPEYGFATVIFIEVCAGTILFAYALSQRFRKTVLG